MGALFEMMLGMSLGATLVALLVLIIRAIWGRRPGILMPLLYALIIARLVLPVSIESPLSMQNLLVSVPQVLQSQNGAENGVNIGQAPATVSAADDSNTATDPNPANVHTQPPKIAESEAMAKFAIRLSPYEIAAIVWFAGVAGLMAYILTSHIRFTRKLKQNREYCTPEFAALLDECRQQLRIRRGIRAVCVSEVNTAAVYGVFRPKLLIAPPLFEALSPADQKHVLLHELSHIKRGDLAMCLLLTVVSIVHWFNPVIWLMLSLMRRDMESFCDASVLKVLGEQARRGYAQTLMNLSEPASKNTGLVAAMFICRTNVKRRIVMITKYRKNKVGYTALALLVAAMIAVTGCTAATTNTPPDNSGLPTPSAQVSNTGVLVSEGTAEPAVSETPEIQPELIATYSIDNSPYNNPPRLFNIEKAAGILNGTVIKPGETLSLNELLGVRNRANGWKSAAGIENGTYTEQFGSGVPALSNALYNAAIRAELTIVESEHHSIPPGYVPGGLDATIGNDGPDLVIGNPYDTDVKIEAHLDGLILIVDIYGPPLGYTVDFTSEPVSKGAVPESQYIYNTTQAPDGTTIAEGESYEYLRSRAGTTFARYKMYYDADGNLIKKEDFGTYTYQGIPGTIYVNGPEPS